LPTTGAPPRGNSGIDLISLGNSTALFGAMGSGEVDVLLSTGLHEDHQQALQQQEAERGALRQGEGPALEIGYLTLHTDQPPVQRRPAAPRPWPTASTAGASANG
jgi:peptide/nickel transport system substrate-binding protein